MRAGSAGSKWSCHRGGKAVVDLSATWKQLLVDLERERDELRVKVHLGKAEARDLLARAEEELYELRQQTASLKDNAKVAAKTAETKSKAIAAEIRATFAKIRKIL
jgi:hypothetical protein